MFLVKAALITNHPELGIRSQPYALPANLDAISMQLSLIMGRRIRAGDLFWGIHGCSIFVSLPDDRRPDFHFNGCEDHPVSFHGPTFLFFSPYAKQKAAPTLSRDGNFHHLVEDMKPGDADLVQTLFSHGLGTVELASGRDTLRSLDEVPRPSEQPSGASGENAAEENSDDSLLTDLFEKLAGAGFDMKLIEIDGDVVGLAASGPRYIERELVEDPGFYSDPPQRGHIIKLGVVAEVSFDPIHFPSPSAFVAAVLTGYMRALSLNVDAELVEPEIGSEYLEEVQQLMRPVEAQRKREPAYGKLESPLLAKLPDEPGGLGRDSLREREREA